MRFKVDENLPVEIAEDLRLLGHAADTVAEEGLAGAADSQVVELARLERRVLLTLDKGIASLLSYPPQTHAGIVLFRPGSLGRRSVLEFVRSKDVTSAGVGVGKPPRGRDRDANSDQVVELPSNVQWPSTVLRYAAVDIGSNSTGMLAAEVLPQHGGGDPRVHAHGGRLP
jgi:predicted nuclease of predicted toxin-antitoxin system